LLRRNELNLRKIFYEKYNKGNDYLLDIISETMREFKLDEEEVAEIIKEDYLLLGIYKNECEHLRLTKGQKTQSLLDLF
jgi:hypothetical protein